jgi:hypothetical protein
MGYRIFVAMVIGATFSGITLAIVAYFATINSNSGGGFLGPERDWWPFAVVIDLIVGLIIGGISAGVVMGFNLSFIEAVSFCGILNLLIVIGFYFFTNGQMSYGIKYPLYSLIPIGLINGAIVSWFASFQKPLN